MADKIKQNFNAIVKESKNVLKCSKNANEVNVDVDNMSSALSTAYAEFIGTMPHGKVVTVKEIRDYFAKIHIAEN